MQVLCQLAFGPVTCAALADLHSAFHPSHLVLVSVLLASRLVNLISYSSKGMAYAAPRSSTSVSPASSIDELRSEISLDSEEEEQRLAQEEWDESVQQLQLLLTIVVLPFFGKWLGRRWSHLREQCRTCLSPLHFLSMNSFREISKIGARQKISWVRCATGIYLALMALLYGITSISQKYT